MSTIRIIEDASDADIAIWLAGRLREAFAASPQGPVSICVPGGTTPCPILAELVKFDLPFSRLAVWPGDDRMVPEDHPASNFGRLRAALQPHGATVMRLSELALPPHLALTWLGMGADGHVASLFPNTNPRADDALPIRRLTPDPLPPEAPFERLTLTIPALLATDALVFVIRGGQKRVVFEAALRGNSDLPIARILAAARVPGTCFC